MIKSTKPDENCREMTINEKLIIFRQKRDESRKENDDPQINCNKKAPAQAKLHQIGTTKGLVVEKKPCRARPTKQPLQSISARHAATITGGPDIQKVHANKTTKESSLNTDRIEKPARTRQRPPTAVELKNKLDEYVMLAENAGNEIARSFMIAIPSESHMKDVENQVLYWLTWIRMEVAAEEWDYIPILFSKAKIAIKSLSGVQAILTAEQQHLAKKIKKSMIVLQESIEAVEHSDPKSDEGKESSRTSLSSQNDIRTDMGEDGISFHELPAPKTLRFSTDEANPSDILPTTTAPVSAPSQNVSSSIVVKEVVDKTCVPMSGGKYADFLKSNQRAGLSSSSSYSSLPDAIADSAIYNTSPPVADVSVSSKVAEFESRSMSNSIRSSVIKSSPAVTTAANLIQSSRSPSNCNSESRKRKTAPSPRGANLDILLGLGGDDDASESEGECFCSQKRKSANNCEQKWSRDELLTSSVPLLHNDLSSRISNMLFSPQFKQRPRSTDATKRGKAVQRIVIGTSEMTSDDEEIVSDLVPITALTNSIPVTMEVVNEITLKDVVPLSIPSMDLEHSSLETVNLGPCSMESKKTSKSSKINASSGNKATVSFADNSDCIESIFQGDVDSVVDSLRITTLSSGCRRSRRLSSSSVNSSLTKCSVTKCKRKGTPHAPRFSRPSSRESSLTSSSSGSSKGSMDVMREECGYGSYFSSMESADKNADDDYDLLAVTPVPKERRSRRLSNSATKK